MTLCDAGVRLLALVGFMVGVVACGDSGPMDVAPEPSGQVLVTRFSSENQADLVLIDIDSGVETNLTPGPGFDLTGSFSPDGRRIVFSSDRGGPPGVLDLYVMELDGDSPGSVTRLYGEPEYSELAPVWSPDGSRVAFAREGASGEDEDFVHVVNSDGTGARTLTPNRGSRIHGWELSWSADGRRVLYSGDWELSQTEYGEAQIAELTVDPPFTLHPITRDNPFVSAWASVTWAPGGLEMVGINIVSLPPEGPEVRLAIADPRGEVRETVLLLETEPREEIRGVRLSPSGEQIVFTTLRGSERRVFIVNRDGSGERVLLSSALSGAWRPPSG